MPLRARKILGLPLLLAGLMLLMAPSPAGLAGPGAPELTAKVLEARILTAAERIIAATVRVETEDGLGSGTLVDSEGLILTSAHVIEGCREIEVTLSDGRRFAAGLLGVNGHGDLALLRVPCGRLSAAEIGVSDDLEVGDFVLAAGHPTSAFDDFQPTLSMGRILDVDGTIRAGDSKEFRNAIKSDVPLSAGSSGGGLWSLDGRLVGVNAAVTVREMRSFSVRITEYLRDAERLLRGERFDRLADDDDFGAGEPRRRAASRNEWFGASFERVLSRLEEVTVTVESPEASPVTGTVVSAAGEILAAAASFNDVAPGSSFEIYRAGDGKGLGRARLVGCDHSHGVAVLRIEGAPGPLAHVDLEREASTELRAGRLVMALGGRGRLAGGILSSGLRQPPNELKGVGWWPDVLQCDLRLYSDQIGSPVLDSEGGVVGLVLQPRLKMRRRGRLERQPYGAFLVPSASLRESLAVVRERGHRPAPVPGFLGVELAEITEGRKRRLGLAEGGVLARRVPAGRPASLAGLEPGDLILAIDGRRVSNRGEAIRTIVRLDQGRTVPLRVLRDRSERTLLVRVGKIGDPPRRNETASLFGSR